MTAPLNAEHATPPDEVCTSHSLPTTRREDLGTLPPLDHHVYDPILDKWIKKPSAPQPFLTLNLSVHPEDYDALKLPRVIPKRLTAGLQVLADTGCQSMLISFKILRKLGIYQKHLLPASMCMNTATCRGHRHNWLHHHAFQWY